MHDRMNLAAGIGARALRCLLGALIGIGALCLPAAPAKAQEGTREITRITGDVYRFQNRLQFSIFVVTEDGVVATDPINRSAAKWLKAEIAARHAKPISHLIYSHSHRDRADGGLIFADTAKAIAQAKAPAEIDGVVPDIRVDDTLVLETGGKTFELTALGPGHGIDLIAVIVRPENVAFVVDAVTVRHLPYRDFPGVDIDGWIEQIRQVEALNFEILAPGQGNLGTKDDAITARLYLEDLRAQVAAALAEGKTEIQMAREITMESYRDWAQYDTWRALNVHGMARWLQGQHAD